MFSFSHSAARKTTAYKTNALWLCIPFRAYEKVCSSDGDEGPDDGVNHVHPERVFHADLTADAFEKLLLE